MQPDGGILFLEINGVCNHKAHDTHIVLEDDLVERLRSLVIQTGCSVILCGFWRHHICYIRCCLHRAGLPAESIVGHTPGMSAAAELLPDMLGESQYEDRSAEIRAWLAAHPQVTRYAIADSQGATSMDADIAPHHVQIPPGRGLTDVDAERCRALLAKPDGTWYFWAPSGQPRPANAGPMIRNKPGAKVGDGVCTCTMLGSTLLIECDLCRKQKAMTRSASKGSLLTSASKPRILA